MLRSYVTLAVRSLLRQRAHAAINLAGLALGVTVALVAFVYVHHEWSYDRFHAGAERLHLVRFDYQDDSDAPMVRTPPVLAPTLVDQVSGFERAARVCEVGDAVPVATAGGEPFTARGLYVDPEFFGIFSFPVAAGDPGTALSDLDGAVLSADLARRRFRASDPVGQGLTVMVGGEARSFTVRAVVRIPANSSLTFDFALSHQLRNVAKMGWGSCHVLTFVALPAGLAAGAAEARLQRFVERHVPEPTRQGFAGSGLRGLRLLPLTDLHFARGLRDIPRALDPAYCWTVAEIAAVVLALACVNYANLAVGLMASRVREVSIRRTVGATRRQLVRQFLAESTLMAALAAVLGLALAEMVLPRFAAVVGEPLTRAVGPTLLAAAALAVVIGLVTGGYPGLVLSRWNPVELLRGRLRFGGTSPFSRGLVVLQFACSMGFVVVTTAMVRQIEYLRSRNLGFDADQVMVLNMRAAQPRGPEEYGSFLAALRQAQQEEPGIVAVAGSNNGMLSDMLEGTRIAQDGREVPLRVFQVEGSFFSTLGIDLLEGQPLSDGSDGQLNRGMLVNQAFLRAFGAEAAIGRRPASLPAGDSRFPADLVITGVVSDFQARPLRLGVEPAIFTLARDPWFPYVYVRLRPEGLEAAVARLQQAWMASFPGRPFAYSFLDEDVENVLRQDGRWIPAVRGSAAVALLIASLGVLGLTALGVARRTREIGIRKVVGASVPRLLGLLTREHAALVVGGCLLGGPVALYLARRWLEGFAYRIELGPGVFVAAGAMTLALAGMAAGAQALRAARANPVEALRQE
ncbi:MAG: FtsX-like permease family protein [Candidatus Latescibacterota bacterium]